MTGPALLCGGIPIGTGQRIGRGGEGEVYVLSEDPSRAVKLYLKPDAAHDAKIQAMIAARLANTCPNVAFPLERVLRADCGFAGFTMRRVADSQPIFELFASGSRRERFPRADWAFLVRTALNVARVVAQVHAAGAVIGDLNSAGFLVSQQAIVTLIDADSFQIAGHRCRVGIPEYTPPELQNVRFGEVDRITDHDAFGLAVLLFQLLALGRHPFAGVRKGRGMPLAAAITQERFAYSLTRKIGSVPPPGAPTLDDFPLGLRTLFERAFARRIGPRPTAAEWVGELMLVEAGLVHCLSNAAHIIPSLSTRCPWCRIEKEVGRPLFPAPSSRPQTVHSVRSDLHYEVVRVVRVAREHASENVQPMWRRSDVKPSKAATKQLRENATSSTAPATATRLHFLLNGHASAQPFVDRHTATRTAATQALDRRRTDLGIWEINARAEKLQQSLRTLDQLKANRPALLAQAKDRVIAAAAVRTMRNLPLDTASVPGIGASLRAQLVRYGIATVADVTRERPAAVPGLGDARNAALLLWRDRIMVEAQRSVVRDLRTLQDGIELETASLVRHIVRAEDGLRADCADLEHRVSKVRKRVWLVDRTLEDALCARDQAVMDLEILGIDNRALLALSRNSTLPTPPAPASAKPKTKKRSGKVKRQPPTCPACGAPMVKRWANTAQAVNKLFLGCSTYPRCTGSRPVTRKRARP